MAPRVVPPGLTEEIAFAGESAAICGIDEAGRGPLAGPVVAAAVVLDRGAVPPGIADSKLLPAPRRAELAGMIRTSAAVGIGIASVEEIDALNILAASELAMCRALAALEPAPAAALVDGNRVPPDLPCRARAVVRGDATCLSIAAASIVAKVTRDALMDELAAAHPGYGWETNRGYGTAAHLAALPRLGITPHHRRSFAPVAQYIADQTQYMGLRE